MTSTARKCCLAAGLILALTAMAAGQVSEQEAYQRMQERIAARAKAAASNSGSNANSTAASSGASVPSASSSAARTAADSDSALLKARLGFKTTLRPDALNPQDDHGERPDPPPATIAQLTKYKSPIGMMWEYITPDPHDGKKHPAVVWLHGGYGGLSPGLFNRNEPANNDQTPTAFLDAHFVVMCPSFRGHNDNPGKFEMFYGEVDDAVAAIDALSKVSYVDPARIYVVGHSTGGTMSLLTAEASGKIRAAFSLCGCPDVSEFINNEKTHEEVPFDLSNLQEGRLRSAVNYVDTLKTPCWSFDQLNSLYVHGEQQMKLLAAKSDAPFHAYTIDPATHFDVIRPLTRLIATKLLEDTAPACTITFSTDEIAHAFSQVFTGRTEAVEEFLPPRSLASIRISDLARQVFQIGISQNKLDASSTAFVIRSVGGKYAASLIEKIPPEWSIIDVNGIKVTMSPQIAKNFPPATIAVAVQNGKAGFVVLPGVDGPLSEPSLNLPPSASPASPSAPSPPPP